MDRIGPWCTRCTGWRGWGDGSISNKIVSIQCVQGASTHLASSINFRPIFTSYLNIPKAERPKRVELGLCLVEPLTRWITSTNMSAPKRRRGLLASVRKNAMAVSRAKAVLEPGKTAAAGRARAPRAPRAPGARQARQARQASKKAGAAAAPSRARILQARWGSSPRCAGLPLPRRVVPPPRKRVALPYKYYARAQRARTCWENLGTTAWHSPLSRRHRVRRAAEAADAELQNAPAPVWAPGRVLPRERSQTDSGALRVSEDVVSSAR